MAINRLTIIKAIELALAVTCLILHTKSFTGNSTAELVSIGAFAGFTIILGGLFIVTFLTCYLPTCHSASFMQRVGIQGTRDATEHCRFHSCENKSCLIALGSYSITGIDKFGSSSTLASTAAIFSAERATITYWSLYRTGKVVDSAVGSRLDLYYSIIGIVLFVTAGYYNIDIFKDGGADSKNYGLIKGSLAIINAVVFLIDALLGWRA